ncbi:MAG: HRDC domain-containing protein [Acidimicrobiia bacterium]|nr:HRDC domain-containing protein [Acidimicrobiia bacterium]
MPASTSSQLDVRWVDSDAALASVVKTLSSEEQYGLDTEFVAERTYYPRLCLVQLAWPGGIVLIDPLACDIAALAEVLETTAMMITHAGSADLPIIERACGARPQALFDTQLAAGFVGLGQPSLVSLVSALLDVRLDKGDQLTDWARRPLSDSARRYAAGDVAHLLALTAALRERLESRGREAWAVAECAVLLAARPRDPDPDIAWWRIKGSRSLRGEQACIAQSVVAWRERRAREQDLPARFVLSELALTAIVQRPPKTAGDITGLRGAGSLPKPVIAGLFEAVVAGRAMDRSELRSPPKHGDDSGLDAAVGILNGWAAQIASGEQVDARLLATREDVKALVNGRPGRLDDGWRAAMVGDDLHALVAGEAVVRLVGGGKRLQLEPSPRVDAS